MSGVMTATRSPAPSRATTPGSQLCARSGTGPIAGLGEDDRARARRPSTGLPVDRLRSWSVAGLQFAAEPAVRKGAAIVEADDLDGLAALPVLGLDGVEGRD